MILRFFVGNAKGKTNQIAQRMIKIRKKENGLPRKGMATYSFLFSGLKLDTFLSGSYSKAWGVQ